MFLRKKIFGSLLLVGLLLSLLLVACGDSPTATPAASSATTAAAAKAAAPITVNVDMVGFKFSPAEITIPAGSTVIWTNKEAAKHDVVADDGSFESPAMEKGATYSRKFDTPGTIGYYCKFHGGPGQGMAAKIIVTPAQAGAVANTAAGGVAVVNTTTAAQTTVVQTTAAATTAAQTTAATQATTVTSGNPAAGTINFRDDVQQTDQLIINFDTLPAPPPGKAFFGWLINSTSGATVSMGKLEAGANGGLSRKFTDPKNANLLVNYDKFIVTNEALDPTPSAPSASTVYTGQLPGPSLIHIRHLLVSFPGTPNKIGLEVGLRAQAQELRRQAESLHDAFMANDLTGVKVRAEQMVNLIVGSKGPDYGDLNKDGKVQNAGDGYGLLRNGDQLGYLDGSKEHANLAANAEGATPEIKLHASHVSITVDNASGWVTAIRDRALVVLKANNLDSIDAVVHEILALANQTLNGVDLKGDGQILPVPGSGGVITSYQHAQLMASIILTAPGAKATDATPVHDHSPSAGAGTTTQAGATTAASATTAAAAAALGGPGQEVKMDITQFKFSKNPITIKAGTKVTWTNQDTAPHTATADNSSWDSGTLQKGQSFSFTFNKVGQVKYHCEVHPNMTAIINVVE